MYAELLWPTYPPLTQLYIHTIGPETRDPTTLSSLQYMSLAFKEASMYTKCAKQLSRA